MEINTKNDKLSCTKAVAELRAATAEIIEIANSGHPGSALSLAPLIHVLFSKILRISCKNSKWMNRDIFILSNGHACPVVYCALYLLEYLDKKDLMQFRKLGSITPGHPEACKFIEAATGPLAQGVGQSVGYAIAMKSMQRYNTSKHILFDGHVYCVVGDGCMEEGLSFEALSIAGHLQLSNLTVIYDKNRITIDGDLALSSSEDVLKRVSALGFDVFEIDNAEDEQTLKTHLEMRSNRPIFILLHTIIARSSMQEGQKITHGKPLGPEDVQQLRKRAGVPDGESIWFSTETRAEYRKKEKEMEKIYLSWEKKIEKYINLNPEKYNEIFNENIQNIPDPLDPHWKKPLATRMHLQYAMQLLSGHPRVFGGSADLAESTGARSSFVSTFDKNCISGTFVNFGVREHGMCSILSGIAGYGWHRAFGSTFLNFVSYGFPALRIAAMSQFPYAIFATHDSIGLGEDGPSHQPIEMLALLRATPGLTTFRPCDGIETLFAVQYSLFARVEPVVVVLSRQKIDSVAGTSVEGASRGGYIVQEYEDVSDKRKKVLLIATGSEVSLAIKACEYLPELNIRIVSLVSFEIFECQTREYVKSVLNGDVSISIEAAATFGWGKYAKYHIGIDTFGASAPGNDLFVHFGFTPKAIARKISDIVLNGS